MQKKKKISLRETVEPLCGKITNEEAVAVSLQKVGLLWPFILLGSSPR